MTLIPSTCGPAFAKMPIRLDPIRPPATTIAITSRLKTTSSAVQQVVETLVHEPDLDLAVPELLEHVVDLVRQLERHRAAARATPCAHGWPSAAA